MSVIKKKHKARYDPRGAHWNYECRGCDICTEIRTAGENDILEDAEETESLANLVVDGEENFELRVPASQDEAPATAEGEVKVPAVFVGELIPLKYFIGWLLKNVPQAAHEKILASGCGSCRKSFREYLLAGNIDCEQCDSAFAPYIQAILVLMKNKAQEG